MSEIRISNDKFIRTFKDILAHKYDEKIYMAFWSFIQETYLLAEDKSVFQTDETIKLIRRLKKKLPAEYLREAHGEVEK